MHLYAYYYTLRCEFFSVLRLLLRTHGDNFFLNVSESNFYPFVLDKED